MKARAAKLHHAATDVDREDNHAPGSDASTKLTIDAPTAIRQPHQNHYFLSVFGLETLRDLREIEWLEDAGLLTRQALGPEVAEEEDALEED